MLHLLLSTALILQPTAAPPGYIVGPQDRLSVTVYGESDLTRTVTVDGDGTFDFPLIGRVKAAGLPLRAIEQQLTARLKNGLYVNPQVSIEVESYRSQVVYVARCRCRGT
jgi:polysaccharide export outer membrane protein